MPRAQCTSTYTMATVFALVCAPAISAQPTSRNAPEVVLSRLRASGLASSTDRITVDFPAGMEVRPFADRARPPHLGVAWRAAAVRHSGHGLGARGPIARGARGAARTRARAGERVRHRMLDDFNRLYFGVGALNYVWYQSRFQAQVQAVHATHGVDFLRRVRVLFDATAPDASTTDVLARLESIAPGFVAWAASMR